MGHIKGCEGTCMGPQHTGDTGEYRGKRGAHQDMCMGHMRLMGTQIFCIQVIEHNNSGVHHAHLVGHASCTGPEEPS